MVLSILAGHRSHHGGARGWRQPGPAGDGASEDAVRRALMLERRSGCAVISMRRRCWGFRGFWTWMPRSSRCSATRKERAITRTSRAGHRTRCTPTGWPACAWSWMSRSRPAMSRRIRRRRCGGSAGPLAVAAARGCRVWDGADHEPGRAGRDAVPVQVAQHAQRQAVDRESYGGGRLAGQGWQGKASTLRLQGWSRHRRVIILRRRLAREVLVTDRPGGPAPQLALSFAEVTEDRAVYEYAVLVTALDLEVLSVAQLYRDRADAENGFDEIKNQWGWGGFTTHDLQRCRVMARCVGLVYNWWSLFGRLADPDRRLEAITSRPLLLHGVARRTRHAGQTIITSAHGSAGKAQAALTRIAAFFAELRSTAEQLTTEQRWYRSLSQALVRYLNGSPLRPPPRLVPT